MRSLPLAVLTSVLVKVRQLIALPIKHVVDRPRDAALIPQMSLATLLGPGAAFMPPTAIRAHLPGRVCLERNERASGFTGPIEPTAWIALIELGT